MTRVNRRSLPQPRQTYAVEIPALDGGLNLYDLPYALSRRECPELRNMLWRDGALACRDGQQLVLAAKNGTGHACSETLFHGCAFFHIGSRLFVSDMQTSGAVFRLTVRDGQQTYALQEQADAPSLLGLQEISGVQRGGRVLSFAQDAPAGTFTLEAPEPDGTELTVRYVSLLGEPAVMQLRTRQQETTCRVLSAGVQRIESVVADAGPLQRGVDYLADEGAGTITLCQPLQEGEQLTVSVRLLHVLSTHEIGSAPGVFFRYDAWLFYKAEGMFWRIRWTGSEEAPSFAVEDMRQLAYTPVTVINADAASGAGTLHQPENRLSPRKTIWYNAGTRSAVCQFPAATENTRTQVRLQMPGAIAVREVSVAGFVLTAGIDYLTSVDADGSVAIEFFESRTQAGQVRLDMVARSYYLPVSGADVRVSCVTVLARTQTVCPDRLGFDIPAGGISWYQPNSSSSYFAVLFTPADGGGYLRFDLAESQPSSSSALEPVYPEGGRVVFFPDTLRFYVETAAGIVYSGTAQKSSKQYAGREITLTEVVEYTFAEQTLTPSTAAPPEKESPVWDADWDGDYMFWPSSGHVLLRETPYYALPPENNTVRITYEKENPEAMAAIMDCSIVQTFGAQRDACIVMAGSRAQPNAWFWNGSHSVMDAGYWPMEQYNLAGDASEAITALGQQQNVLLILQENRIGKTQLQLQEIDGRQRISMDYTPIHAMTGCDLPGSVQLVENNLVFCNTRQGVHMVKSTTPAMENNVGSISRKINGAPERPGLLAAVRGRRGAVVSMDDGRRYWLCVDGSCWVWDYELSPVSDAAWFYLTDIHAIGFLRDEEGQVWHLNADGQITQFVPSFSDYGRAIRKSVTLPAQTLGGYERYKDVDKVILSLRSATSSRIALTYLTDYEMRRDETDVTAAAWQLVPRNLAFRSLALQRFAAVAVRRPACRHVRHFSVRLENEEVGMDMAVVSAQIFWKYAGRDK